MFVISNEYDRAKLLEFVDSKQNQTGIIWGPKEPGCVIITSGGKHGEEAGYKNEKLADGSWLYIGQGSKGDQDPYIAANAKLTNGKMSVLLFSAREATSKERKERGHANKFYMFEGIFEVGSWDFYPPETGARKGDKLVRYHLIPAKNIFSSDDNLVADLVVKETASLYELREKLKNQNIKPANQVKIDIVEYRIRSEKVKAYALKRANGICECCNRKAPFLDIKEIPFLEVHHIFRLADDGPDAPENVAGICPNCHREAHYGKEKDKIKEYLAKVTSEKEVKITSN